MKEVIEETIKYMWRSEKNRLFMIVTTALVLIYSFFILPNISGDNQINIDGLEREMNGNIVQFEDALDDGLIVPNMLTGTSAYISQREEYVVQRDLLTALKQGDSRRYLSIDYRPESTEEKTGEGLEQIAFSLLGYELEQPYQKEKNQVYLEDVENINFHLIHDRTSLQQIHLFMIGHGPVLLLLGLIFLISDVHVKDRELKTQKIAQPMNWQRYLFIQSLTALAFVALFYFVLLVLFFLVNGLLYGFGSFSLPIGYHEAFFERGYMNQDNFQVKTIAWFIIRSVPFITLLTYLFSRLNTLISLWTRQSVVTMVISIFMLVFQFIYYGADSSELAGIDISYFPQSYINFGAIITGRFEFKIARAIPTLYSRGLIVLFMSILMIELFIYLTSKKITRQVFLN